MRPMFTIHAGEFLLSAQLDATFKGINIWVPAKDTGVDLLATGRGNKKAVSFQVKFSRDFLTTHMEALFQKPLRVCCWFFIGRGKIVRSTTLGLKRDVLQKDCKSEPSPASGKRQNSANSERPSRC